MTDILITGGLGYIGSHVAAYLAKHGHKHIVILDNLSNSDISIYYNLQLFFPQTLFTFYEGDIRDKGLLHTIFLTHSIKTVVHMAALKSVKESFEKREEYFEVNVGGTERLLDIMRQRGCKQIVFSSSATVYGSEPSPVTEKSTTGHGITNPYGETKLAVEQLLEKNRDLFQVVILRYFNPIGAHSSGLFGENPRGDPNNLFPILLRAVKEKRILTVFGNDYSTPDGTCIRDYIDINDLAEAHVATIEKMDRIIEVGESPFYMNVGTGKGTSVLELIRVFEESTRQVVSFTYGPRRAGDIDISYTDVSIQKAELIEWKPKHSLYDSCRNGWAFMNKIHL